MVQVIWLVLATLITFTAGYLGYSRYLARFVELDDSNETPAHKYEDGQEYVPAKKPVLLGHHYSSIAGGAPIVGPITAGVVWGWLPALLWIAIGNPLMGSVHDFVSLSGSLRHEGKSIGYIIGEYVGERGKKMLLWFAFLTIILVVAVFALVVAIVFNAYPQAATASMVYIALALLFGVYLYQLDLPFIPGTAAFVLAVFAGVFVGIEFPIALFPAAEAGTYPAGTIVLFGSGLTRSSRPRARSGRTPPAGYRSSCCTRPSRRCSRCGRCSSRVTSSRRSCCTRGSGARCWRSSSARSSGPRPNRWSST